MTGTSARGVFVTGTDTGVGKTVVACALLRGLRARGIDAGALKPVETGVHGDRPSDALALRAASGDADPLSDVCPQRFALPAAPTVAARAENAAVHLEAIRGAHGRQAKRHAFLVIEGAGGLLVPAADGLTMADLAREFAVPLLVVARAALGTINHTRLTLEAAARRGLDVAGVVISHSTGRLPAAEAANLALLREGLQDLLVGEIPALREGREPADSAIEFGSLLQRLRLTPAAQTSG
ncbi:MAG: dethiobiotin synthase [Deltaproteobacteria bacterium]|nr:MAG: dethiobiotin synthase [Deltaproteobacteria bacterium]